MTPDPAACGMFPRNWVLSTVTACESVSVEKVLTADTRGTLPSARPREPSNQGGHLQRSTFSETHTPSPVSEDLGRGTAPWETMDEATTLNTPRADHPHSQHQPSDPAIPLLGITIPKRVTHCTKMYLTGCL